MEYLDEVPAGVKVLSGEEGGEKSLPLIIQALEGKDSVDFLKGWMLENKTWLDAKMLEHGRDAWGLTDQILPSPCYITSPHRRTFQH